MDRLDQAINRPLALTMGDPGGIGLELTAKIYQTSSTDLPPFCLIADPKALEAYSGDTPVSVIQCPSQVEAVFNQALPVIPLSNPTTATAGMSDPVNGPAIIESIDRAFGYVKDGLCSAIVTNPIQKSSLYAAGFTAPGHTEYLASLDNQPQSTSVMMLACEGLKVVPVTVHIPIKDVASTLTADHILHAAYVTNWTLKNRFGIKEPRIAIAGLNPHAGEDGTIGLEEGLILLPAIRALRDDGIHITDPQPADTLFHSEARGLYDAALCMYHDQALIPIKTLDFYGGVNITMGLDVIRTSPDHGTALDIAGKGLARPDSLKAAIIQAVAMVEATRHA